MICPYCNKPAKYGPNEEFYGRRYGKSYMCYYCKPCNAYVGVHENDKNRPLGTMANQELRNWRRKAHQAIDPFWRSKKMKRVWVYTRLKRYFKKDVHIGESDIEMCRKIVEIAPELMSLSKEKFSELYPRET